MVKQPQIRQRSHKQSFKNWFSIATVEQAMNQIHGGGGLGLVCLIRLWAELLNLL